MAYSSITKPTDYFNTVTYTGDGTSPKSITGVGHQPDWVWIKKRDGTTPDVLYDAVRGNGKQLISNDNSAEDTNNQYGYVSDFETDGFQVTQGSTNITRVNASSATFVAWNWKANGSGSSNSDGTITTTTSANSTSGFSIIKYTGTGSGGATIGHGLSKKPKAMIVKRLSGTGNWGYWQDTTNNGTSDVRMVLDSTNTNYNNHHVTFETNTITLPSSNSNQWSGSGSEYIAYCFANVKGYSRFGSYIGNGNANGSFIYTGFKPIFVMIKKSSGTSNWTMWDNKRSSNEINKPLYADTNAAESAQTTVKLDLLSNGFKIRGNGSNINTSGGTYIYMAFAEEPLVANVGSGVPATAQ